MDILFLFIFSIVILFYSYKEGIGHLSEPSAGSFGFIVGIILLLTTIFLGVSSVGKRVDKIEGKAFFPIFRVVGVMLIYGLILERLGLLLTTFIISLLLYMKKGHHKALHWFAMVLATTFGVYILFVLLLKCQFPEGIIGRMFFR